MKFSLLHKVLFLCLQHVEVMSLPNNTFLSTTDYAFNDAVVNTSENISAEMVSTMDIRDKNR